MKLNIPTKHEGQELEATEVNQIVEGVNEVDISAKEVTYVLAETDFIEDGIVEINGKPVKVIKVNPNILPNDEPVSSETRETILTKIGIMPIENLPEQNLDVDWFVPSSTNVGTITINEEKLLQFMIDNGFGSGKPPLDKTVITFGPSLTNRITINWTEVPNATSYKLQTLISGSWIDLYTGILLTYNNTGLTANTSYTYRVLASDPNYATSTSLTATDTTQPVSAGEPGDLAGYYYDDPTIFTGVPPISEDTTPNIFRRLDNGFANGQPGKRFAVGARVAIEFNATCKAIRVSLMTQINSDGNYVAFEFRIDGSGVVAVFSSYSGNAIDEVLATQPTNGEWLDIQWVSGTTTRIFKVTIFSIDKTTVVYTKNYTLSYGNGADCVVGYQIGDFAARLSLPQSKGTIVY